MNLKPSVEQIKAALVSERDNMTEAQMLMLEAHFRNSSRSAAQLAEAAGFKGGYSSANLQFGIFGRRLAGALGISPLPYPRVLAIVDDIGRVGGAGHWQMKLKPDVRKALQELGWFETTKRR